jgi:hypothetical protein
VMPTTNARRGLVAVVGAAALSLAGLAGASAQSQDSSRLDTANQAAGRGGVVGKTPRDAAPIDLTGYWVSIVSEDWRFRMFTPPVGDFPDVPLNDAGTKVGKAWDAVKDEAASDRCKAYGAPNIMRVPGRFHITWADDHTLKMETDAGMQTRLFRFAAAGPAGPPSRQGLTIASWDRHAMKAETTNLLPGYLQSNGAPFSAKATMTEYFDVIREPGGEIWLIDTAVVADPTYLTRTFKRSTHLRKQADATGWDPEPCLVRFEDGK